MAATFTVPACTAVEARISSDLALLREAILHVVPRTHVRTLALGGGFGRGEGTAFMANGQPHIVNDYDIRVVHDLPALVYRLQYAARLDRLAEEYAARLPLKQIDFGGQHYRQLSRTPPPTIANYEFFHGYHVFHGEDLLAPVAARIPVELIPLWEGTWLLRNRAIGLILAGLYFLGGRAVLDQERENLWIETNKAILAVGDAFLLAQGCYHWSYAERGRRMAAWPGPDAAPWRESYCAAISLKVEPGACPYDRPVEELTRDWYQAQGMLEQGLRWFEARRTGHEWSSWADYVDQCKEAPLWRRPRFWGNVLRARASSPAAAARMARVRTERVRSVGLAANLLSAVRRDGIDPGALDAVGRAMGIRPAGTPVARWRNLAAFLLRSIHPTGEAGRVAARA